MTHANEGNKKHLVHEAYKYQVETEEVWVTSN